MQLLPPSLGVLLRSQEVVGDLTLVVEQVLRLGAVGVTCGDTRWTRGRHAGGDHEGQEFYTNAGSTGTALRLHQVSTEVFTQVFTGYARCEAENAPLGGLFLIRCRGGFV